MVFPRAFKLYLEGKLNKKKMRAFCCEQMLHKIMDLIQKNNFGFNDVRFINDSLRDDIVPYLISCYPKSEETEVNKRLSDLIRKVDRS